MKNYELQIGGGGAAFDQVKLPSNQNHLFQTKKRKKKKPSKIL